MSVPGGGAVRGRWRGGGGVLYSRFFAGRIHGFQRT